MLDARLRQTTDPIVERLARWLAGMGASANMVTVAGLAIGLGAAWLIAEQHFIAGLAVGALSRLCDGLDGAVARRTGKTDFGGLLDIVLDFVFYGAIPLGFILADPQANAIAGAVLILTFYANGGSVLALALMLEKQGKADDRTRAGKALAFTEGLMEASETYLFFALFCLFPGAFATLALVFAGLTAVTFVARLRRAARILD
ncbi:CDP-alcohol phosphatidyltransferase family protein [Fulvimarina sp. 2208YS6-2-32]|uniref:CDP-alcohol phosphatidyltransferase family protein n=1 Tax=Fulvimarina uroteuthidis TaxID=3098149 RepID=A0ABU5HZZ7_9HYPH|nr:CDP-alcohol phosphatidyltransferase family protein [Fulvimarina sp. 2208YS6-2-32]MDY8108667.1 CDP-alcohol phosphatidyltransferase family protein [Fulvimarina sp. 2208YS6-2-32]